MQGPPRLLTSKVLVVGVLKLIDERLGLLLTLRMLK